MSAEQVEVLKAAIAAAATISTALLVYLGVVYQARKPSTTKPPVGNTGKALEEFNGTQNEFMALVVADNKDLRDQITEVKDMVTELKQHQDNFLSAVRRYLTKIYLAWGRTATMPWPDDEDFLILEDTLPTPRDGRKL
jgi:hypothetical protein